MRRITLFIVLAAALILTAGNLFAQTGRGTTRGETLEIKIASPLPQQSPWGRTLDRIAAEWSKITNGRVRLRVLHGGSEGSEDKMFQSLSSDTIQAAVFTSFGLNCIDPVIMTLSAPFFIRNDAELAEVMKEIQPELETRYNSGNFFILAWSKAGFVNIFSKEPVFVPDDLKKLKIASNHEAAEMNTAFKMMGYQVVEAGLTDLGQKVATGAIQSVYLPPAGMAAYQIHRELKHMLPVNIAPVIGGMVINQVAWRRIANLDPQFQQNLIRATRQIAAEFDASMSKVNSDSVTTMTRTGLIINKTNQQQEQLWYSDVERVIPTLLGTTYDRNLYNKINDILIKYRRGR